MSDVVMPRLSDTMEEGTVLRWLKRDGEHVARGEELVEIETDKASMTYESDREGTLQTVAREGDTLAVGELIARIGPGAEATPPKLPTAPAEQSSEVGGVLATATSAAAKTDIAPNGAPAEQPTRVKASPLARRIARKSGIDLASVTGSGPGGRIVKADVEAQAGSTGPAPVELAATVPPAEPETAAPPTKLEDAAPPAEPETMAPPAAAIPPGGAIAVHGEEPSPLMSALGDVASAKGKTTMVELSRTQRTIARRMAESKATMPDFTLTTDIDMAGCAGLRAELKRLSHDEAPTYNDMIVKACALALRRHPRANGSYRDGRFELHARVNVGVAVAVNADDPSSSALVVPTVFDADGKALGEIARETRALAQRVREGSITPPELSGATFTVSNLGMYGIRQFAAIVNPPQAAILAVGEIAPRPVVRKKKVIVRLAMTASLTCDHRILYGADAALFLRYVRELLEEPAALTL